MPDLPDFQRGQIVSARMAGTSVTETARMLGVSRGTVSKVLTAFEREGKTSPAKHRSGRKSKLPERDSRTLNQIVRKDRKNSASKITAELNKHLQNPVSTITVRLELHKPGFHGRAAIRKPIFSKTNVSKGLEWCKNLQNWSLEQWKNVIFSDESSLILFSISGQLLPMVQGLFPAGNAIFQDDNTPIHTARIVKESHEEHSNEVEHLI